MPWYVCSGILLVPTNPFGSRTPTRQDGYALRSLSKSRRSYRQRASALARSHDWSKEMRKAMRFLQGLQGVVHFSKRRLAGAVALCICLLLAMGTLGRSQETAALENSATPAFTAFEAPGAGTG